MPQAWRILQENHAAAAFSGDGAAKYGGRWNSKGVAVVYTSGSMSLAALEILVHLNPILYLKYLAFRVEFDNSLVEKATVGNLPPDWKAEPPAPCSQAIGDQWAREGRTAILEIPSILIPCEPNYLLNPAHPDFGKILIGKPEPFAFDPRLVAQRP